MTNKVGCVDSIVSVLILSFSLMSLHSTACPRSLHVIYPISARFLLPILTFNSISHIASTVVGLAADGNEVWYWPSRHAMIQRIVQSTHMFSARSFKVDFVTIKQYDVILSMSLQSELAFLKYRCVCKSLTFLLCSTIPFVRRAG